MMKILILEANPHKDLSLNDEIRELQDVIRQSRDREEFQIDIGLSVRSTDLQKLMLDSEPNIVHFCGHGTGQDGLVFRDKKIDTDALSNLFELCQKDLQCVVLNACYTEAQADEIVKHIKYVIGMNQAIRDDAAIAFSIGFYRALGYGCSFEDAFKFGKNAIQLAIDDSLKSRDAIAEEMRKLVAIDGVSETVIAQEHLKPILLKNNESNGKSTNEGKSNFLMLTDKEREALIEIIQQVFTEEEIKTICRNNKGVFGGYLYDRVEGNTVDARFSSLVDYLNRKNIIKVFLEIVGKNEPYFKSLVSDLLGKIK